MVSVLKFILVVVPLLFSVAFVTLLERKILSLVGIRLGPNKVSVGGVFQPLSDAAKLANKAFNLLSNFCWVLHYFSCVGMLFASMSLVGCFSFFPSVFSFKNSLLLFFLVLGFNSLSSMISGWSTFTKFSLLGSLRTTSQLISYEAVLYVCVFSLVISQSTFDVPSFFFLDLKLSFIFFLPCFFVWVPTFLAELNRTPYDFSEGESELVSGFNTEHGSSGFTLVFLSEYSNIIFFCLLGSFFFFWGFSNLFFFLFLFFVIWIRSVLPRFRFDKLMYLAWKFYIPFLTFYFLFLFFFF